MNHSDAALREELVGLPDVVAVYLFGSHARGDAGPLSDIDVGILLKAKPDLHMLLDLVGVMMNIFGDSVDVSILNEMPLPIQYRVIAHGKILYVRDDIQRARFEAKIIDEYLDYKPRIDAILEAWLRT